MVAFHELSTVFCAMANQEPPKPLNLPKILPECIEQPPPEVQNKTRAATGPFGMGNDLEGDVDDEDGDPEELDPSEDVENEEDLA